MKARNGSLGQVIHASPGEVQDQYAFARLHESEFREVPVDILMSAEWRVILSMAV